MDVRNIMWAVCVLTIGMGAQAFGQPPAEICARRRPPAATGRIHGCAPQGDLFDHTWQNYPWGSVYADNVRLRNLDVERDVPVHGVVLPWKEVLQSIEQKRKTTEKVCMGPEAPFLPGCEVAR